MPTRRIGWQGPTRARHLRSHLELGLTRWQQGWFSEPLLEARVRPVEESEVEVLEDIQWWTLDHEGAALHFGTTGDMPLQLGAEVLCMAPMDDSALVEGVGTRCFAELCCSLWGGTEVSELAPSMSPGLDDMKERYGGLFCGVEGLPAGLWVFATRAWCDRFGPERNKKTAPLAGRDAALKTTMVTVSAHIELGTISLADSLGWTVGEVLVTDASRRSPVALKVVEQCVRTGTLTDSQGTRAVMVA